jgi:outer membrane protein OmpA-like peptidoglycan-associated protein
MRRVLPFCLVLAVSACAMTQPPSMRPGFVVFFTERSAALDGAALHVVADAAQAARAAPGGPVVVAGFTDSGGSAGADVKLSQARAAAVANALVADGVAAARISRQGRGQTHEDPGVASRRVEISVGG